MPPHPVQVTVSDTAGSGEGTAGTVVHVHVQEASSLAYLVQALGAARLAGHTSCAPVRRAAGCCAQELRVLGVAQILLGLVCAALGLTLCFTLGTEEYWKATPFWTAAVFVASGTFSILCQKYEAGCWVLLAAFLALASVVVAVIAMVISVQDIQCNGCHFSTYYCDPKVTSALEDETWRQQECLQYLALLLNLLLGVRVLLLATTAGALVIAACCLVCTCQASCCRAQDQDDTVRTEPLMVLTPMDQAQPGKEMHVDSA